MRAVAIASALACACAAAACLFPSLDGLTNAKDAADDLAAFEGGIDATSQDGSPSTTFCANSTAKFCDDFDDSDGSVFAKWNYDTQRDGVTRARDVSDASAPFGIRFVQTAIDASYPFAALESDFTAPIKTSAHLAFDLRVDEFPAYGDLKPIATLQFDASLWPNTDDCVAFALQQGSAAIFECVPTDAGSSTYPRHNLSKTPKLGQWTHVDMTLTFSPGNITVNVSFDGFPAISPTTLDPRVTYAAPALQIGMVAMDKRSSASYVLDNVTLDWQ